MSNTNNKSISRRNLLGLLSTASLATGTMALAPGAFGAPARRNLNKAGNDAGARVYNIRDFGAKGDGQTPDTAAIQAAIDACHQDRGGTVLVPAGVFLTGTVELKSNVTLHIAAQGKLLGSGVGSHYHPAGAIPTTGEWTMGDGNTGLLFAANAENITLEGSGTIDGQGAQFRSAVRDTPPPSGVGGNRRPHHLLFYQCKNLTIRDIFLADSAYHSVRICVCSFVKLDGLRIHSRVNGNNDGFHFISNQYVHVSNCDVQCQDDACALFGSNKFVTITNCSFSTRWSVFRFGGGYSENITVSNCIIYETYGCPIKMRCDERSHFENITFSNIVMNGVTGPISIGLGPQHPQPGQARPKPGIVRNIAFNGIRATVVKPVPLPGVSFGSNYNPGEIFSCIILNGMDDGFLENISFNDVQVHFPGGGTAEQAAVREVPKIASEYYAIGVAPAYGMFARNVRGLTLNNVRFVVETADLRPAVVLDHVSDAALNGLGTDGVMEAESALRFIDCREVLLSAARLLKPASVFLQVEGAGSKGIQIDGGNLSKAGKSLVLAAGAVKEAVKLSLVILALLFSLPGFAQTPAAKSEWAYTGKDGKLIYKTTPAGDRMIDFSYAGYMGGGVALPAVAVKYTISPSGKDDTEPIQSAINQLAAMPAVNGYRGAVLLSPGVFTCSATITIPASGIVLRGSGAGKNGTTIKMTGSRHAAFVIGRNASIASAEDSEAPAAVSTTAGTAETRITNAYVPSGSRTFTVANATAFAVGDMIDIKKPVTDGWIHFMQMDNLTRDGKPQTWIGKTRKLVMQRKITAIAGNKITIDVPLADAFDAKYLDPPGVTVARAPASSRITQAGVEHLHVQCPPLEIDYGHAPYSGIRIAGDDCWVKDVYFEETMNTTTLAGNRITMQQVVITHTYPNLGASKPADFSLEGSQNLIDRCECTGDNTYFVWTSSLVPGPNVLLNCTFRGHGSRIQPHQRWSTGLLVDNCTMAGGGIDFMNRGVAGSGHGWTMAWAVAWNCIAKTYIIQNPPGAVNWAIGCTGSREQTARLFDSSPILAKGVFDSHNQPVTPQSLYLAQLSERLGAAAMLNTGYSSNSAKLFNNKSVQPLAPLKTETDKELGTNLALHRPVNTNDVRGNTREFGGEKAVDGDDNTWWATNDETAKPTLEIDMEGPVEINALSLGEAKGLEHVQEYKVEGQVDSDWKLLSQGTTIGNYKLAKFPTATVWKVRLTIIKAQSYSAINKIGLYRTKGAQ